MWWWWLLTWTSVTQSAKNGMWAAGVAAAAVCTVGAIGTTHLEGEVDAAQLPARTAAPTSPLFEPQTTWKEYKDTMKIFTGNSNRQLAGEIAALLGRKVGKMKVGRFADGEVNVQVYETVRGKDIYIVQPTCKPVNESLMELFLMVSTMRRASARKITCVIPYYGYARQDRKVCWPSRVVVRACGCLRGCELTAMVAPQMTARVPISAADVARLLEAMGADRVRANAVCRQCRGVQQVADPVSRICAGSGRRCGPPLRPDPGLLRPSCSSGQPGCGRDRGQVLRAKEPARPGRGVPRRRRRVPRQEVRRRVRWACSKRCLLAL